ncbi:RNA recognition motif domain [Dillenia turbinata]|uniref:RNA recognition motif domain n=1 Tax=Dillenia turbinata TaxID=194707 RepID=A0AAN8VZ03_9MAGN
MATKFGLVRRLSTSIFSSQSSPVSSAAAAATSTATASNPPQTPSNTLFVSGLNKRTTSEKLHEAFSKFGEVIQARVITDRATGYSKGFGFVKFTTVEEAKRGMEGMDAQFLDGWVIFAEYARPRLPPGQFAAPENVPKH